MRNKTQKFISLVAVATMLASTLAFSACGNNYQPGNDLTMPDTNVAAVSNGGFAVEQGEYVYFINGVESYTANNTYGDVVKGALYRIKKADLTTNPGAAEVVIPTLIGSQNFETGLYIYGDRIYYATPTTDKNLHGEVENSWIDFKSAKLDGTETMKGYMFRLSSNTTNFRFVEVNGVVYCMYEESGALKSYNTQTKETTVLVKGASSYFFDEKNVENPNVYYTMGVTYNIASDKATAAKYNQIYKVNAAATATVDAKTASYTVKDGRTYTFDKAYLEKQNEEAKKEAQKNNTDYEAIYVFDDYSTYPYVNLGTLVVDGVGTMSEKTQFNDVDNFSAAAELDGYTYTITRYENNGVYYTRKEVTPNTRLYYVADTTTADAIGANTASDVVALDTTKASASALFEVVDGTHRYIYLSGNNVYRATAKEDGSLEEDVKLFGNASGKTLWKTEGDYLYFYGAGEGTSGNVLSRIKYNADAESYHPITNLDMGAEYRPVTLDYVDMADSWYLPEIIGDTLLYANAQTVGSTSYNYIYATKLGTAEEIEANNEKYEAVLNYFDEELTIDVKNAATYLFRTYVRKAEGVDKTQNFFVDLEDSNKNHKEFNDGKELSWLSTFDTDVVKPLLEDKEYIVQSDLIQMIGAEKETDTETMRESWKGYLPFETAEEEENEWQWWYTLLIVVGSVLVVGGATAAVLLVLHNKKVKAAEAEATVNAYKTLKLDTTDDKSIDVYADDTPAESAEEATEAAEEVSEPATEEVAVEAEEVSEETPESENV